MRDCTLWFFLWSDVLFLLFGWCYQNLLVKFNYAPTSASWFYYRVNDLRECRKNGNLVEPGDHPCEHQSGSTRSKCWDIPWMCVGNEDKKKKKLCQDRKWRLTQQVCKVKLILMFDDLDSTWRMVISGSYNFLTLKNLYEYVALKVYVWWAENEVAFLKDRLQIILWTLSHGQSVETTRYCVSE